MTHLLDSHGVTGARDAAAVPRSLFITNDFPPRVGGAQSYYWRLIQTLDPAEVVVLAPADREAPDFDGGHPYTVVRTDTSVLWPLPSLRRLAGELIDHHGIELVQLGHPLPAGMVGPWLKHDLRVPYLVFLGGAEVTGPAAVPGGRELLRWVLGEASLLVAVSRFTAAAASRQVRGRVPAAVLRPAIDAERYTPPTAAEAAAAKEALGVQGPLIVCVGRLVLRKGQDRLIEALALLDPVIDGATAPVELALVGHSPTEPYFRRLARRAGVADRVRFVGEVSGEEMRRWLRAADVFAMPSRTRLGGLEVEGFGLVYAEAALTGLPVIAGLSGGAPEAVVADGDGVSGLVVDGSSAAEVAVAVGALLGLSERERRVMGERGRRLALARHAPDVVRERYRELLRQATNADALPSPDPGGVAFAGREE
jgi:phosphatidylinositol alpha-1,6-mannosyltransferase